MVENGGRSGSEDDRQRDRKDGVEARAPDGSDEPSVGECTDVVVESNERLRTRDLPVVQAHVDGEHPREDDDRDSDDHRRGR